MTKPILLLLTISLVLGCMTVKTPDQPDPIACMSTPKATPTPKSVVLAWESCKGFHACFTDKEFKALVDKLNSLEMETH